MLMACAVCFAHKQSDSYLTLKVDKQTLQGQWDIALRDLDLAVGLDADADERIIWREVRTQRAAIERYAFDRLHITTAANGKSLPCPIHPQQLLIDDHVDGAYAVLKFAAACSKTPEQLSVDYRLLFPLDPNHRGLLQLRNGDATQSRVLSQDEPTAELHAIAPNGWQEVRSYTHEGIWHIWQGYDHLLFLLTLLLPAVVIYRNGAWQPSSSLRASSIDILRVVSAFTLAHSITLSLAVMGFIKLPSRWVESAIAATVLLGALNILRPWVRERRWLIALIFGLVHGLGFASVLTDLGLPAGNLLQALFGFNLGVELGQLAIVALLMPAMYAIRASMFYRRLLLPAGASCVCLLAAYWILTRAFPAFVPTL